MDTVLELVDYALIRPVQTLAVAVFLYQTAAVVLRERRQARRSRLLADTRIDGPAARPLAA
jgi:hypothetical protein